MLNFITKSDAYASLSKVAKSSDVEVQLKVNLIRNQKVIMNLDQMEQALEKNNAFLVFISSQCYNNSRIALECAKYFGTTMQIQQYRNLCDDLIVSGIDIPNDYQYFKDHAILILEAYVECVNEYNLDYQAIQDILELPLTSNTQDMLNIYTFEMTLNSIQSLQRQTKILTQAQITQLGTMHSFISLYQNSLKALRDSKYQDYDKFKRALYQKNQVDDFNIETKQQKQLNRNNQQTGIVVNPQTTTKSNEDTQLVNNYNFNGIKSKRNASNQINYNIQDNMFEKKRKAEMEYFKKEFSKLSGVQLQEKQYKGVEIKCDNLDISSLKLRQGCLRERQVLFESSELQIGMKSQLEETLEGKLILQLTLVIGNKATYVMEEPCVLFDAHFSIDVWQSKEEMQAIQPKKQVSTTVLLKMNCFSFQALQAQFVYISKDKKFTANFHLPSLVIKFMQHQPIRNFKQQWIRNPYEILKSPIFTLNEIIKNPLDILKFFPMAQLLSKVDDFLQLKKDLKFGLAFKYNIKQVYLLKLIIRQDMSAVVQMKGLLDAQNIIEQIVYVLSG